MRRIGLLTGLLVLVFTCYSTAQEVQPVDFDALEARIVELEERLALYEIEQVNVFDSQAEFELMKALPEIKSLLRRMEKMENELYLIQKGLSREIGYRNAEPKSDRDYVRLVDVLRSHHAELQADHYSICFNKARGQDYIIRPRKRAYQ